MHAHRFYCAAERRRNAQPQLAESEPFVAFLRCTLFARAACDAWPHASAHLVHDEPANLPLPSLPRLCGRGAASGASSRQLVEAGRGKGV